jgi:hypothetical protein
MVFVSVAKPVLARFLRYLLASQQASQLKRTQANDDEEVIEMIQAIIQLVLAVAMGAFFAGLLMTV